MFANPNNLNSIVARIGAPMLCALALLATPSLSERSNAQQQQQQQQQQQDRSARGVAERMNANTLTVVTGSPSLAYAVFGYDLAAVLNDGDELRILPVISQGAFQNVRDVRYLYGVDIGFAQTNILGHYRRTGEIADIGDKIVYIAKICNEEVHVVTRSNITSLEQLQGRKVNFNTAGSGTQLSARDIFERFGIKVEEVNMRQNDGLEKLRTGEIAATVLTSGKPSEALAGLKASDGYRILPVPFIKTLHADYLPSALTHDDYPNLIAPGQTVETIASGTILFAYNWPKNTDRYRRIDKFVKAFFGKISEFQKAPRHPKWQDTNLAAIIPGWKRFEGSDDWLKNHREQEFAGRRDQFNQFLAERKIAPGRTNAISESERNKLFEDFIKWNGAR
jgi:TRAP transporter TAXI family solute receptor